MSHQKKSKGLFYLSKMLLCAWAFHLDANSDFCHEYFPSKIKVFNYLFVCTFKRDICHKLSSHKPIVSAILTWCFLETQPCCLPVCKNPFFYFLTCFQTLFVISTNCFSAPKQKWTYYACSEFFFFPSGTLVSFNDLLVVWCTFLSVCNWTMWTEIFHQTLSCG